MSCAISADPMLEDDVVNVWNARSAATHTQRPINVLFNADTEWLARHTLDRRRDESVAPRGVDEAFPKLAYGWYVHASRGIWSRSGRMSSFMTPQEVFCAERPVQLAKRSVTVAFGPTSSFLSPNSGRYSRMGMSQPSRPCATRLDTIPAIIHLVKDATL